MHVDETGRRKKPRFTVNLSAYYKYEGIDWQNCVLDNLNLDGAGLLLNQPIDHAHTIQLKIEYNNDEYIFDTRMVNLNRKRIGVKFTRLKEEEIKILHEIINAFSNRYKI